MNELDDDEDFIDYTTINDPARPHVHGGLDELWETDLKLTTMAVHMKTAGSGKPAPSAAEVGLEAQARGTLN